MWSYAIVSILLLGALGAELLRLFTGKPYFRCLYYSSGVLIAGFGIVTLIIAVVLWTALLGA